MRGKNEGPISTPNEQLAGQLIKDADAAMHRRRVLLVAAAALNSTTSITAARKMLSDGTVPDGIRSEATAILDSLTTPV